MWLHGLSLSGMGLEEQNKNTYLGDMDRRALIADLKSKIAGGGEAPSSGLIPLGAEAAGVLPGGGLRKGALHEVAAAAYRDMGAATGFAAALASAAMKHSALPVLWCEAARPPFDMGRLYGAGLAAFGIDPARLLVALPPSDTDCLWIMEEALRAEAFAAVIGEVDGRSAALTLSATRRLQLAAEETETPALLFTGHGKAVASVAVTRWHVAAGASADVPGMEASERLPGAPRWSVSLMRCRGGRPGTWLTSWNAETAALSFAPLHGDSEAAASAGEGRGALLPFAAPVMQAG